MHFIVRFALTGYGDSPKLIVQLSVVNVIFLVCLPCLSMSQGVCAVAILFDAVPGLALLSRGSVNHLSVRHADNL